MKAPERINKWLENQNNSYWLLVFLILIVAAAFRFTDLNFSYSNDELSALVRLRFDSFSELVDKGFYVDGHPGGIQVFLYYWVKLFGMSETAVRLPFAAGGVLAVYYVIRIFTRWFGPAAGLLTGAFVAFLEFPVLFSQIARPYGSGLLFSMMMTWFWTRLLFDEKPQKRYALAFALTSAACMYNHYFSFLLALIVGITGLFILKRDRILYYLTAGLVAALLFSPHIYITLNHLSIGGVGLWLAKPEYTWLLSHLFYIFNQSYSMLLLAGITIAILFLLSRKIARFTKFHFFAVLFFLMPFIVGFYYSRLVNPVLQDSVLIFSFPFFIAFLFSFSGSIPAKKLFMLVFSVLILGSIQTIAGNKYYLKQHFGEFRGIAKTIAGWNQKIGSNQITNAISINNPWYLEFYLDQSDNDKIPFVQYDNRGGVQLDSLSMILNDSKTEYFMYAWTKPVPLEIEDMILARFPCIADEIDFSGLSEAKLFRRNRTECLNLAVDTLFKINVNNNNEALQDFILLDSLEYSPGFDGTLPDFSLKSEKNLVASVEAMTEEQKSTAILVISFQNNEGETLLWKGARFDLFCDPKTWSQVRQTIKLPDSGLIRSHVKVYVWNKNKEKLKIRKLSITTEKSVNRQ